MRGHLRVIFDRSSFHGERFDKLLRSPLRQRIAQRHISVYHTPIFLEETLEAAGSTRATPAWRAHLKFAADICNGGFFLPRDDILRGELLTGDHRRLIPSKPTSGSLSHAAVIAKLHDVAASTNLEPAWTDSAADRLDTQNKKNNQHALYRSSRLDFMSAIKTGKLIGSTQDYPYSIYRESEFVHNGRALTRLIDKDRAHVLADRWAANPNRFPFYTAFVEGLVYSQYYAAIEHNRPLDRNAQADYEQLAYLTWADVIVSDDKGFFRSAFDTIWRARGKEMLSAQEFSGLLSEL